MNSIAHPMATVSTVPPVDRTPTGKVPAAVAQAPISVPAAIAHFEKLRPGADANMNRFLDKFEALITESGDPAAVCSWFLEAVADRRLQAGA